MERPHIRVPYSLIEQESFSSKAKRFFKRAPRRVYEEITHSPAILTGNRRVIITYIATKGTAALLRKGIREANKSAVVWSGAAGLIGGGLIGTAGVGFFVGGATGAIWEYGRQINHNLDHIAEYNPDADPELAGRTSALWEKTKGLGHGEAWQINSRRRMILAVASGAFGGAVGGWLVESRLIPKLTEFIEERVGVKPALEGIFGGDGGDKGPGEPPAPEPPPSAEPSPELGKGEAPFGGFGSQEEFDKFNQDLFDEESEAARKLAEEAARAPGPGGFPSLEELEAFNEQFRAGEIARQHAEEAAQAEAFTRKLLEPFITAQQTAQELLERQAAIDAIPQAGEFEPLPADCIPETQVCIPEDLKDLPEQDQINQLKEELRQEFRQELAETRQEFTQKLAEKDATIAQKDEEILRLRETLAAIADIPPAEVDIIEDIVDETEPAFAAETALDNLGDSIPLAKGSNPWEVSRFILNQAGVANPSNAQIMELDRVLCQQNGISVPEWGIRGNIDARRLPVGFMLKLTPGVKKTALAITRDDDTDLDLAA